MNKQLIILILILISTICSNDQQKWSQSNNLNLQDQQKQLIDFRITLKQQNMDVLDNLSKQVSDSDHSSYGEYLTAEQIASIVKLEDSEIEKVQNWIKIQVNTTICPLIANLTVHKDHINVQTCFANIQKIFPNVKFQTYTNSAFKKQILRTEQLKKTHQNFDYLNIPKEIQQYINSIHGVTDIPVLLQKSINIKPQVTNSNSDQVAYYPQLISKYYGNPINQTSKTTGPQSQQAVVEFEDQYYDKNDQEQFNTKFNLDQNLVHVVGNNNQTDPGAESMLDIEYIAINQLETTDLFMGNGDFIQWAQKVASNKSSPLVQSISYGAAEILFDSAQLNSSNIEFQKLGLQGFTILVASGDDGPYPRNNCSIFSISFPASSTYVTAVGASLINFNKDEREEATIFSGGGFSSYFTRPSYQDELVTTYLQNQQSDFPKQELFNSSNRATPDVSALGINYYIIQKGQAFEVNGTSASTPTFASIIAYINAQRQYKGLKPLGFLNPTIYKLKSVGYDIIIGNNSNGCDTLGGFQAVVGYDAISGLGAPRYKFLEYNLLNKFLNSAPQISALLCYLVILLIF